MLLKIASSLLLAAQVIMTGPSRKLASAPAGSPPTHVQGCAAQASGGTTSVSCTLASAITAGNLLYVCVNTYNGSSLTGLDISGDSGAQLTDLADTAWSGYHAMCVYVPTASGGGSTITATTTSTMNYPVITVDEIAGVHTLDVSGTGNTGTADPMASNAITTTANGDYVVGYMVWDITGSMTAGSGFTIVAGLGGATGMESQVQTSAGSITATATKNNTTAWFAHVAAFKP